MIEAAISTSAAEQLPDPEWQPEPSNDECQTDCCERTTQD